MPSSSRIVARSIGRIEISGEYGVQLEVEDVEALLAASGSRRVFGVSSGAIIALEAALRLPQISKVAAFEPPLFPDREAPRAILDRVDRELAEGRVQAALVTAMLGAELGPGLFRALPRPVLEWITRSAMDRPMAGTGRSMRQLAPVLHDDFSIVAEASGPADRFGAIPAEVLLVGGTKSAAYLQDSLARLQACVAGARRVELSGLDHSAPVNREDRGHPDVVARELMRFFS